MPLRNQELATDEYINANKKYWFIQSGKDALYGHDHNLGLIFRIPVYNSSTDNKITVHDTTGLPCKQEYPLLLSKEQGMDRKNIVDYIKSVYQIDTIPFNYSIQLPLVIHDKNIKQTLNKLVSENLSIKQLVETLKYFYNTDKHYYRYYSILEHKQNGDMPAFAYTGTNTLQIPEVYTALTSKEKLTAYQLEDMMTYAYGQNVSGDKFEKFPDNVYTLEQAIKAIKGSENIDQAIEKLAIIDPIIITERKTIYDDDTLLQPGETDFETIYAGNHANASEYMTAQNAYY